MSTGARNMSQEKMNAMRKYETKGWRAGQLLGMEDGRADAVVNMIIPL
jgi:hypothetical protein